MKYEILDEHNVPIRRFQTKAEAVRFLQPGWSIRFRKTMTRYQKALQLGDALI